MSHFKQSKVLHRVNSTASSGGTLTLLNNSARYQQITGTSNHTIVLPDTTTLPKGLAFVISNRGTGTVTVNYNGGSLAKSMSAGTQATFIVFDNATSAGDWDVSNEAASGSGGSLATTDKLAAISALGNGLYKDSENTTAVAKYNPEEVGGDFWVTKAPLTSGARYNIGIGTALNGLGYCLSGSNVSIVAANERYDADNNYWIQRTASTSVRISVSAFSNSGYLYSGFGSSSGNGDNQVNTVERYNDSANTWATMTSGISQRARRGVLPLTYTVCVAGAATGGAYQNEVEAYNSANDTWFSRSVFPVIGGGANSWALNGFGYVSGGLDSGTTSASYKFNETINAWTTNASLNLPRGAQPHGDAFNGFGHINGGTDGSGNPRSTMEQYNDASATWTSKMNLLVARDYQSNFTVGGLGFICGGVPGGALSSLDQYRNFAWSMIGLTKKSKLVPSTLFASATLNNTAYAVPVRLRTDGDNWKYLTANTDSALKLNQVLKAKFRETGSGYVAGGVQVSTALTSTEFYNPNSNIWINRSAAMVTGRYDSMCGALNGIGYAFGGYDNASAFMNSAEKYNEVTNAWAAAGLTLATATAGAGAFTLNGYVYFAGGDTGGGRVNTSFQFNDAAITLTSKATINTARGAAPAGFPLMGRGYIAAGNSNGGILSSSERYDDVLNTWTTVGSITSARLYPSGFTLNGSGYSVGGFNGGALANVDKYNPQSDVWTAVTGIGSGKEDIACFNVGGFGYAASGDNGSTGLTSAQQYNDASNSWSSIASLNAARGGATKNFMPGPFRNYEVQVGIPAYVSGVGAGAWIAKASSINSRVLSSNYVEGFGYLAGSSTSEKYNPFTNAWSLSANPTVALSSSWAFNLLGYGYIGGSDPSGSTAVQEFNPTTVSWSAKTATTSLHGQNMGDCLNGFGYTPGGGGANGNTSNEQYNKATNAWASKAVMSLARYASGIVTSGYLYVYGGGSGATTSTEYYNDASDTWAASATLPVARYNCGTLLLKNGNVLVCGNNGGNQSEVQEFFPATNVYVSRTALTSAQAQPGRFNSLGILTPGFVSLNVVQQYSQSVNNIVAGIGLRVTES